MAMAGRFVGSELHALPGLRLDGNERSWREQSPGCMLRRELGMAALLAHAPQQ